MKGCKNCPAFAKCTVTYRGSGCAALRSTYGVETDPEIITNADRIRGMDDNELAEFLSTKLNVVEDVTSGDVNQYKYTLNFNPKMWLPEISTIE